MTRRSVDRQRSSEHLDPFAHTTQTQAGLRPLRSLPSRRIKARPSICYPQLQPAIGVGNAYPLLRATGVAVRVVQRFLEDAVHGDFHWQTRGRRDIS